MSSAWTILYNRRYRTIRKDEAELEADPYYPDQDSNLGRSRHHSGRRYSESRDPHVRCSSHRAFRTEREPVQLDHSINKSGAGNNNNGGATSSEGTGLRLTTSNQLPGVVLQARARLLERLRGCSLSGSREAPIHSGIAWEQFEAHDELTVTNESTEAETELQSFEPAVPYADLAAQTGRGPSLRDGSQKKASPLDWEAQYHLEREVYGDSENIKGTKRDSLDCCICIERFQEGDELIRLHCAHRFHLVCLEPWMLTTANCPYCRTSIVC